MVAYRLRRNFKYLKYLKKAKRGARCAFLKSADKDTIICLCDCVTNILKGNVKVKPKEKKALKRHKTALRELVQHRKGIEAKRKLLIQKGGFLPFLLAPILSAAGGLLGGLINN
jgi:hypothetical protein